MLYRNMTGLSTKRIVERRQAMVLSSLRRGLVFEGRLDLRYGYHADLMFLENLKADIGFSRQCPARISHDGPGSCCACRDHPGDVH